MVDAGRSRVHGGRSRTARAVAAALLALVTVGGASAWAPAAGAATTLSASPTTDLVDGALVSVSVTGLPADVPVVVVECSLAVGLLENCQSLYLGQTGAAGNLEVTVRIFAVLATEGGAFDCRTATTCVLDAYRGGDALGSFPPVPLAFDPAAPLGPAPTFRVQPSSGVRPGELLTFTGSGLNADTDIPIFPCLTAIDRNGLTACALDTAATILVHTDATGSFRASAPLDTAFTTDSFTGGFPPDPACTTATCVRYALTPSLPAMALMAAVDHLPPPPTPLAPVTPATTPAAVPVAASPPFTG